MGLDVVRVGLVGVGKMGLSHLSIVGALSGVEIVGVCDSMRYLLDVLEKYTHVPTYTDADVMIREASLDAIVIASPTGSHYALARAALDAGVAVFCEKPLTLSAAESNDLAARAREQGLVTQVGYHNRYVAAFAEVKKLLEADAIGPISHCLAEAYGPVVLREAGSTWRSRRSAGGGCLYDYAAHPLDLLQWYLGNPASVSGSVLNSIFSAETEDEVYTTLRYSGGASAQLSVNWSDESQRKMTTKISLWGRDGHIYADRQECQVYLRSTARVPDGYRVGWNVKYTTELTEPVEFYLRGEEYTAQMRAFVDAVRANEPAAVRSPFEVAAQTDAVIERILADSRGEAADAGGSSVPPRPTGRRGLFGRRSAR